MNALAQGPAMMIQAAGQPRMMALLHLADLPLFIGVLAALTLHFGIVGTALATLLRGGVDAVAVLLLARRDIAKGPVRWRSVMGPAGLSAALLAAALWPATGQEALWVFVAGLLVFAVFSWKLVLEPAEPDRLRRVLRASA